MNNWSLPYETPEYINKIVTQHEQRAAKTQQVIDDMLANNKPMYFFISGYVVNGGGTHGFDTKSPIYGYYPTRDQHTGTVLVEVVGGGVMWLLYKNEHIHLGTEATNEGRRILMLMQSISQ